MDRIPTFAGDNTGGTAGEFFVRNPSNNAVIGWGVCAEPYAGAPAAGGTFNYTTMPAANMFERPSVGVTGMGAVNWLLDNYFESNVVTLDSIVPLNQNNHWAFVEALHEVLKDWGVGGTTMAQRYAGLDADTYSTLDPTRPWYNTSKAIIAALKAAAPAASYVSTKYSLSFYANTDAAHTQDIMLVTPIGGATLDFGDYASFPVGSSTRVASLRIGAEVDAEIGLNANAAATGDDGEGLDDEDGITLPASIDRGQTYTMTVNVTNTSGATAYLNAWIDYNRNGSLTDSGEQIATNTTVANGTSNSNRSITFTVPTGASLGASAVRVRLTSVASPGPDGRDGNGEVEDQAVTISPVPTSDFGDFSLFGSASSTLLSTLKIGATTDMESVPATNLTASGDDSVGTDDEDGVTLPASVLAGTASSMTVNVTNNRGATSFLSVWIDFNNNGILTDPGEQVASSVSIANGTTNSNRTVNFTVPASASGNVGVRVRLTSTSSAAPTGAVGSGEVEDHLLNITPAGLLSVGNRVWIDTDGDGLFEFANGELPVDGVRVNLHSDNGNGVLGAGDVLVATRHTSNGGFYRFDGLTPGEYIVEIDASNFATGGLLEGFVTTTGTSDPDNNIDNDDNGIAMGTGSVASSAVTLTAGAEPVNDGDSDANTNLSVDFGFRAANTLVWDAQTSNHLRDTVTRHTGDSGIYLADLFPSNHGGLNRPYDILTGPGGDLFVTSSFDHKVVRYKGRTGALVGTAIPVGNGLNGPSGITMGPDGHWYVTSRNSNQIKRYNGSTGAFMDNFVASGLNQPFQGLLWSADNKLYVGNYGSGQIQRYTTFGTLLDSVSLPAGVLTVRGFVFGPDANLYVVAHNQNVYRVTTGGTMSVSIFGSSTGAFGGISFGPDGHLYVTDLMNNVIRKFHGSTGVDLGIWSSGGALGEPKEVIFRPLSLRLDYGDLASAPVASAEVDNQLRLGPLVDSELAPLTNASATADDKDGTDDEDGVQLPASLTPGRSSWLLVTTTNLTAADGWLSAWVDFDGNGSFSASEKVASDVRISIGSDAASRFINFTVPDSAVSGNAGVRVRLCSVTGAGAGGPAGRGEVEDYVVPIGVRAPTLDFGDFSSFPSASSLAASALILGATVDAESAASTNSTATGDDLSGTDDEDGLILPAQLIAGHTASIDVVVRNYTASRAFLNVWVDFDRNGSLSNGSERIVRDRAIEAGEVGTRTFTFSVPVSANLGLAGVRARLTSIPSPGPGGQDGVGEVEDAVVNITSSFSIGDLVWSDVNNNGLKDTLETGLAGVSVELWNPGSDNARGGTGTAADTLITSAVTSADGRYFFNGLSAGYYFVKIPAPPLSHASSAAVTLDNGVDNDSNGIQPGGPGTAVFSPVVRLQPGTEPGTTGSTNVDDTLDFGFHTGTTPVTSQFLIDLYTSGGTVVDNGIMKTVSIGYTWSSLTSSLSNARVVVDLPLSLEADSTAQVQMVGSAHTTSASYNPATRKITYVFVEPLAPGSSGTLEFSVRFPNHTPDATLANLQGTSFGTGIQDFRDNLILESNADPADVLAVSIDSEGAALLGQPVTYRIRATNFGQSAIGSFQLVHQLPTGTTFVAATSGGVFNGASSSVAWSFPFLDAGDSVEVTVTAVHGAPPFVGNQVVRHTATASGILPPSTPVSRSAFNDTTLITEIVGHHFDKIGSPSPASLSGYFTYHLTTANVGNVPLENYVVEDPMPPEFLPRWVTAASDLSSGATVVVTASYKTTANSSWRDMPGGPREVPPDTDVGWWMPDLLAPGEEVTALRFHYNQIPPGFSDGWRGRAFGYMGHPDTSRDVNGQPITGLPKAVSNTATVTYRAGGVDTTMTDTAIVTLLPKGPIPQLAMSYASPPAYSPLQEAEWQFTIHNAEAASAPLIHPVCAALLPSSLEFVPNSLTQQAGGALPPPSVTTINNYNGTGRQLLRLSWSGDLPPNYSTFNGVNSYWGLVVKFKTRVKAATAAGNYALTMKLTGHASAYLNPAWTWNSVDVDDLDGDGDLTELLPSTEGYIEVGNSTAIDSVLWVKGDLDADFTRFPDAAMATANGVAQYKLVVTNPGNIPLTGIRVMNIFPHIGDVGVVLHQTPRGSNMTPVLNSTVTVPSGVTVQYGMSSNPTRSDLDATLTSPVGAASGTFSATPPAILANTKALLFDFGATVLAPGESRELTWSMKVPSSALPGQVAWSSIGQRAQSTAGLMLPPSEPRKVGLTVPFSIGSLVWSDLNYNGVHDAGEPGIPGVTLTLHKPDGSPAVDPLGAVVPSVTTNASGVYAFPSVAFGDYFVRVAAPSGYVPTYGQVADPDNDVDGDSNLDLSRSPPPGFYESGILTFSKDSEPVVEPGPGGDQDDSNDDDGNMTVDFGFHLPTSDFGDMQGFPVASSIATTTIKMGPLAPDAEPITLATSMASGDDASGVDDEDGVKLPFAVAPGATASMTVNVSNSSGAAAYLNAWMDFNRNGVLTDAGEQVASNIVVPNGTSAANRVVSFTVPASTALGNLPVRVRLTSVASPGPDGADGSGEVEDHIFTVGTCRADVVFLLDQSGSIDATEYANMTAAVHGIMDRVWSADPTNRVSVVNYAGSYSAGTLTPQIWIESDFTTDEATAKSFTWRATTWMAPGTLHSGDDAHGAVGLIGKAMDGLSDSGIISPQKTLSHVADRPLVIFLFTDADRSSGTSYLVNTASPGFGTAGAFENFTTFKTARGSKFVSVIVPVTPSAISTAAAIASAGGSYTGPVEPNPADPDGSGSKPRLFSTHDNFVFSASQLDEVARNICMASQTATPVADFGDAASLPQASSIRVPSLRVGATVDSEFGAPLDATATGDDLLGSDDEDGVTLPSWISAGASGSIIVNVTNTSGSTAYLNVWADFNGNGSLSDAGEQLATNVAVANGASNSNRTISFTAPASASGFVPVRVRLTSTANPGWAGPSGNGEVEDHLLEIRALSDYGDATGYAAASAVSAANTPKFGALVDYENATQADDNAVGVDEDGVYVATNAILGKHLLINYDANTTAACFVNVWVDWNRDGDFSDAGEQVLTNVAHAVRTPGTLRIPVPLNATPGPSWVRARISSLVGAGPTGSTADGEVEDHPVTITDSIQISGVVFEDANNNGQRDAWERLLPGVQVFAGDMLAGGQRSHALTDATGGYSLLVPPGTWRLSFHNPAIGAFTFATPNVGSDLTDSDATGDSFSFIAETANMVFAAGASDVTNVDCGLVPAANSVTYTADTSLKTGAWTASVVLPKYHSATASLASVSSRVTVAMSQDMYLENRHSLPATMSLTSSGANATATFPTGSVSSGLAGDTLPGTTLLPDDGVYAFNPGAGLTLGAFNTRAVNSASAGAFLAVSPAYQGAAPGETMTIPLSVTDTNNWSGGTTFDAKLTTYSQAGVSITYYFEDRDYGDHSSLAMASSRLLSTLRMGASVDHERTTLGNATATGDDSDGLDDEDGVTVPTTLLAGQSSSLLVDVTNTSGATAYLNAWIDFNRNGSLTDAGEQIASNTAVATGSVNSSRTINFTVPASVSAGAAAVRVRLTSVATPGPDGHDGNGEVEDYVTNLQSGTEVSGVVFEDINYGGGAGRSLAAAVGTGINGVRVELYRLSASVYQFQGFTTTATLSSQPGSYRFTGLSAGNYAVRVVNSGSNRIPSTRSGDGSSVFLTQTFRTDASSGAPAAVTGEVGGRNPAAISDDLASPGTPLLPMPVGSLFWAPVTLGTTPVTGVDFGFSACVVVNTNDSGLGSLRQSIINANALSNLGMASAGLVPGMDNIVFTIPGAGPHTIALTSGALPVASTALAVQGFTQPGSSTNTLLVGSNASLRIVIDGLTTATSSGLTLGSAALGSVIRGVAVVRCGIGIAVDAPGCNIEGVYLGLLPDGLTARPNSTGVRFTAPSSTLGGTSASARCVISGNDAYGVLVSGDAADSNYIVGCYIGTNAAGTAARPNGLNGIYIFAGDSNVIGDSLAAARVVISGNGGSGIRMDSGATSNKIQNCYIGLTADGLAALGNAGRGLDITSSSTGNLIGGDAPGAGNVISGNTMDGVRLQTSGNIVQGNIIGLNAPGTAAIPNAYNGIELQAGGNTLGGANAGARNVVSGNTGSGIAVVSGSGNVVQGNYLGLNAAGTATIGNGSRGIYSTTANTVIGGALAGQGNWVAGNLSQGIMVSTAAAQGVSIRGNSVWGNVGLGIDIGNVTGITPNDGLKNAAVANSDMDYPVLTSVFLAGSSLQIAGYVGNDPSGSTTFGGAVVEVFLADNSPADQNGPIVLGDGRSEPHGEGRYFIGTLTASATGLFSGTLTIPAAWIPLLGAAPTFTATATDAAGNTSEFAANLGVSDFGDSMLPVAASQVRPELKIGALTDVEVPSQRNAAATADDLEGVDDEDGVTLPSSVAAGSASSMVVNVTNTTGSAAFLNVWIDFNNNGQVTDAGEQVASNLVVANGTNGSNRTINFTVPSTAPSGNVPVRVRLTSVSAPGHDGNDGFGEVEDHLLLIEKRLTVGNLVFVDHNFNGVADAGEGISNVTVQLFAEGAVPGVTAPFASQVTSSLGTYLFTSVPSGRWFVHIPASQFGPSGVLRNHFSVPGQVAGDDHLGEDGIDATSPHTTGVSSAVVELLPNVQPTAATGEIGIGADADDADDANGNLTIDFGFQQSVGIGNLVFIDANFDGVASASEGVNGVRVEVYDVMDVPGLDTPLRFTTTSGGGLYSFMGLPPGVYRLHIPASNFQQGQPLHGYVSGTSGSHGDDNVGEDGNNDTVPAIDGVSSGVVFVAPGAAPTAASGETGIASSSDDAMDASVDLTIDFGFQTPMGVGNLVFADANGNGRYDADEGVEGVEVELYSGGAVPGYSLPYAQTWTNAQGRYRFDLVPSGAWKVHIPQGNFMYGAPLGGMVSVPGIDAHPNADDRLSENGLDSPSPEYTGITSSVFEIAPGSQPVDSSATASQGENGFLFAEDSPNDADYDLTIDFGFTLPDLTKVGVGNLVFEDKDGDGVAGAGEGISGVTLRLYAADALGSAVGNILATTTTNSDGHYYFGNLQPGRYIIHIPGNNFNSSGSLSGRLCLPGGSGDNGVDDNLGHNAAYTDNPRSNGVWSCAFDLAVDTEPVDSGSENGRGAYMDASMDANVDLTIDFGFYQPMGVGNLVFVDMNGNGKAEASEGLGGVLVQVYRAGDVPGVSTPVGSAITESGTKKGRYMILGLLPGYYFVHLPASEFQVGKPLYNRNLMATQTTLGDDNLGQDGIANGSPLVHGVSTAVFPLLTGQAPAGNTTEGGLYGTDDDNGASGLNGYNTDLTRDFGFLPGAGVGNLVFHDENNNGRFDPATESPISGVPVQIWTSAVPPVLIASTVTNEDGLYLFNVSPGTYHLRIPATAFAPGAPLHGALSSTDPAASSAALDDNGGEDGQDDANPSVQGIRTRDLTLALTGQPTSATGETGYESAMDDAFDASCNLTIDFGFRFPPETPPQTFAQWQAQNSGLPATGATDDADNDGMANLLEHALGLNPLTTVAGPARFRVERSQTGQADIVLVRPVAMSPDIRYVIQGSSIGGNWTTLSLTPVGTFPGDGTQVLRYPAVNNLSLFSSAQAGRIRLVVELDADLNGVAEASATSAIQVFMKRDLPAGRTTLSQPLMNAPVITGVVGTMVGAQVTLAGAAGSHGVAGALVSGRQYFLHVLNGTLAGHRFEVNESGCGASSIALVTTSPLNTLAALPSSLVGSRVALRMHMTVAEVLPFSSVSPGYSPATADNLLVFENGAFVTLWAGEHGGVFQWLSGEGVSTVAAGGRIVSYGEGLMVHLRSSASSTMMVGEESPVRTVIRLGAGSTFVGTPGFVAQSPQSLGMLTAGNFVTGTPSTGDRVRVWQGDANPLLSAYDPYYYATPADWRLEGDAGLASFTTAPLFKPWRATFIVTSGERWIYWQP